MAVVLKTVGVIVKDMGATLTFYRALGLPIPDGVDGEDNVDAELPNGATLGFLTEAMAQQAEPRFVPADGSSLNLQFACGSAAEVDQIHATLVGAGYQSYTEPWDAFWGQRFARITDPDGRIVNLYAPL